MPVGFDDKNYRREKAQTRLIQSQNRFIIEKGNPIACCTVFVHLVRQKLRAWVNFYFFLIVSMDIFRKAKNVGKTPY